MKFIIQTSISLLIFVMLLAMTVYAHAKFKQTEPKEPQPVFDITVINQSNDWATTSIGGKSQPEKIPFIKINSVSLGTDKENLYIKFQLGDKLPLPFTMPSYSGDRLRGVVFYLDMDENYFSAMGEKNPGGSDVRLKMSFYDSGDSEPVQPDKISVNGELVDGGPGSDYFIASYPFHSILFYESNPSLVFTARALAISQNWQAGISGYELRNSDLAATRENNNEIRINLSLK